MASVNGLRFLSCLLKIKHVAQNMHYSAEQLEQARHARDPRFDGRFFIGVKTTGIYCRPICPVKMPKAKSCTFFLSAAAASEAGYRPCLRCRPEASPGTPAWQGTSTTVNRALRPISEGALDEGSIEELGDRLGVTSRHLSRFFAKYIGASPLSVAQTRRLHFAKKLLDETNLSMTEIGLAAGYKSVRRFNDHVKQVYKRSPSQLRAKQSHDTSGGFTLQLGYREPFDFGSLLNFLRIRAIPGVEVVDEKFYSRTIRVDGQPSRLKISQVEDKPYLRLQLEAESSGQLLAISNKVRRLFDLDADPAEVGRVLKKDKLLGKLVDELPGQRVPGCWSEFEIAVRAIVGQQVSVKGATTVMGRIAERYGTHSNLGLCFPEPEQLADLDVTQLSMPMRRAQAIKDMSQAVALGQVRFDSDVETEDLISQLVAIKGIGPWTAQYVAMRALNDPDAFLEGDLVLEKVASRVFKTDTRGELLSRAEKWRPWRAYAGMHLWRAAVVN